MDAYTLPVCTDGGLWKVQLAGLNFLHRSQRRPTQEITALFLNHRRSPLRTEGGTHAKDYEETPNTR